MSSITKSSYASGKNIAHIKSIIQKEQTESSSKANDSG